MKRYIKKSTLWKKDSHPREMQDSALFVLKNIFLVSYWYIWQHPNCSSAMQSRARGTHYYFKMEGETQGTTYVLASSLLLAEEHSEDTMFPGMQDQL